jgi:Protein of unknown function (DUF4232)
MHYGEVAHTRIRRVCQGAVMKLAHARWAAVAVAVCSPFVLTACGSSAPSAHPTVTVTVTAPAGSTSSAAPSPTPPAGPPGCGTTALTATLGRGEGAAGSTYYPIDFTNNSGTACTLYGYPGVSFITAAGHQVGAAATESLAYPRRVVTLDPGETAHAELQIVDAHNYPSATCSPIAVHRLKVFPPGQTSPLYLSVTATACTSASVRLLSVQTVQPGAVGQ